MLAVQLRHLLPEWQEILGVPTVAAAGSGELALVDPAALAPDDPRHGEPKRKTLAGLAAFEDAPCYRETLDRESARLRS